MYNNLCISFFKDFFPIFALIGVEFLLTEMFRTFALFPSPFPHLAYD